MSFSRAAIKRFNDAVDNGIPPPGAYDPKFATDVGVVASTTKGSSESKGRQNGNKSRSEDSELSQFGRVSRESSFTRKSTSSVANAPDARKRDPVITNKQQQELMRSRITRISSPSVRRNSNQSIRKSTSSCTASSSASSCTPKRNPEVKRGKKEENNEVQQHLSQDQGKSSSKLNMNYENDEPMCPDVIHEIQNMAQTLQVEVSEYKRRLANEIIRSKELEAKKLELEFTVKSLLREIERHESSKKAWEESELHHQMQIEELNVKSADLEQQIDDLHAKRVALKGSEDRLLDKVVQLEDEKVSLQNDKLELQTSLEELQRLIQTEEKKRLEAEERCKELTAQMESCYQVCENRTADLENTRETLEVKIQELTQQREDLLKELDSARRELETQKTLMELARTERQVEQKRQDDYIS